MAAVVGHVFPVWLGFRGGKGVATALGVFLALTGRLRGWGFCWCLRRCLRLTRYVSLASIVGSAAFPLFGLYLVRQRTPMVVFGFVFIPLLVDCEAPWEYPAADGWDGEPVWGPRPAGPGCGEGGGMSRIAILGAGAWGTALAISLARRGGHRIVLWSHSAELAEQLSETGENLPYLPGYTLPVDVVVTSDLPAAIFEADIVLCVTPSEYLRGVLADMAPLLTRDQILVSATKGLEEASLLRMSQVIASMTENACGVLSGPSFAAEVAAGLPTAMVAAASDTGSGADDAAGVQLADAAAVYE